MPLGWLLAAPALGVEQASDLDDLDAAMQRGSLRPRDISRRLSERLQRPTELEPDFFGDPVVNNSSIVVWVGMRIEGVMRSILLCGDLEKLDFPIYSANTRSVYRQTC